PFNAENAWFIQAISSNTAKNTDYHFAVGSFSSILVIGGLTIAWFIFHKGSLTTQRVILNNSILSSISFNFWYIDYVFNPILKSVLTKTATKMVYFDKKILDNTIDSFAILQVVLAHIISWIDRIIVDGFIKFTAWLTGKSGDLSRKVQGGKIQAYISWTLFTTLLLVLFIFFNT
ncbi:MAG: hypothetical protein AAGI07_10915, partial [Bacteroidota bacterium]